MESNGGKSGVDNDDGDDDKEEGEEQAVNLLFGLDGMPDGLCVWLVQMLMSSYHSWPVHCAHLQVTFFSHVHPWT